MSSPGDNNKTLWHIRLFVVAATCASTLLIFSMSLLHAETWQGRVIKVLDGDSLIVKRGSKVYKLRLYGIDTPEYGQDYYKNAARYTRKYLLGKTVSVEPKDIDKYDRTVALVRLRTLLINEELVRAGMAWVYPWFCREKPLCSEMKILEK